tara:strand:+ start:649 stop:762 length:114 start_codon:yes stop_codon:yes gene_type:complete
MYEAAVNATECAGILAGTLDDLRYTENDFNDAVVPSN